MKHIFLFTVLFFQFLSAQNLQTTVTNMSSHVYYLSDDKLEGRATGSHGEQLALQYISQYFKDYGLQAKGDNGFIQPFNFTLGKSLGQLNGMMVNDSALKVKEDYFPMNYSASTSVKAKALHVGFGIHAPGLYDDYKVDRDYKGKIFLISISSPDGIHPHSKYLDYTDYITRIKTAESFGASGVVFYNIDANIDDPEMDLSMNVKEFDIPVVFVKNMFIKQDDEIVLNVDLKKNEKTGKNVVGYVDNGAKNTVVIGAHYDHLGWGENGGSLYRGEPAIHNGADDNASGVSLMLELARTLKQTPNLKNNYLFIAFSGEELGLYGSKSFMKNATIDTSKILYMLNFDMVGRLDEEKDLAVNGVGTSPKLKDIVLASNNVGLNLKTTESGMGPSDHASFYLANQPVLHFYTGNNSDYHKPSDDAYLINFEGMGEIYEYALSLIKNLDKETDLPFTKTKDTDSKNTPRFKVTLGVVPDYMFDGVGMKIDGVTDGKPAQIAGIQAEDIVVKMGDIDVTDMMAYMTALSKFEKGEEVIVKVIRDKKPLDIKVTF
ncbi:MAG: M28 family peptidase [Chitinophagales bacterium]